MNFVAAFVRVIDRINDVIGRAVAWLTLAMVLVAFAGVVLRYGFDLGWIWLQESYVWLNGVVFMLGAAYTLLHEGHVRVDLFYRDASPRFRAFVNLFGVLFLLIPMVGTVAYVSWPYVIQSWAQLEGSHKAGGLAGLFLLKSVLFGFSLLLGLQGLALAGRSLLQLVGRKGFEPEPAEGESV